MVYKENMSLYFPSFFQGGVPDAVGVVVKSPNIYFTFEKRGQFS